MCSHFKKWKSIMTILTVHTKITTNNNPIIKYVFIHKKFHIFSVYIVFNYFFSHPFNCKSTFLVIFYLIVYKILYAQFSNVMSASRAKKHL